MLFSGRYKLEKDAVGNYFIDRDGSLFRFVLDFLRDGEFERPTDAMELALLKLEFEYYRLPFDSTKLEEERNKEEEEEKAENDEKAVAVAEVEEEDEPGAKRRRKDKVGDPSLLLDDRERLIFAAEEALEAKIAKIEAEKAEVASINAIAPDAVALNVGGVCLRTTRHALCSAKESMLEAMFRPGTPHKVTKDRQGHVFIDRDGGRMRLVLAYLRNLSHGLAFPPLPAYLQAEFERLCLRVDPKPILSHLSLDETTLRDTDASSSLSADRLSLKKLAIQHMSISSTGVLPIGASFRTTYISNELHPQQGWFLVGVHSDPRNATFESYKDKNQYGINVCTPASTNCGAWADGVQTLLGRLNVQPGSVLTVTLLAAELKV